VSPSVIVNSGGTIYITNNAAAPTTAELASVSGQVSIPPGNYMFSSLQVRSGGSITIDPAVQGQTQIFLKPGNSGGGVSSALYFANGSNVNMTHS
jgi:hypothetical protein